MFTKSAVHLFALTALTLLLACGGGGSGDGGSTGTLVLSVTDAPFPAAGCLAAAEIQVWKVEAKGPEGFVEIPLAFPDAPPSEEATPTAPAAPKPPDGVQTQTIDLLDLVAGLTELLGEAEVPTGAYTEVRVHIVGAMLLFEPDETEPDAPVTVDPQPFKIPSGISSGLKIKIDPPVMVAGDQMTALVLDVDLAESFHTTGLGNTPTCDDLKAGETKVIFHPVIRALAETEVGIVTGTVTEDGVVPVGGAQVAALPADVDDPESIDDPAEGTEPAPTSLSAEDGAYALLLEPGEYDIYVQAADALDAWTLALEGVIVTAGETTADQDIDLGLLTTSTEEPTTTE